MFPAFLFLANRKKKLFRYIWTKRICDALGYNNELGTAGLAIVTGLIIWQAPTGCDINEPNQCRTFGINFCDDAWDKFHDLGIHITERKHITIPFELRGSTTAFNTCYPSKEDLMRLYDERIALTCLDE